MKIIFILSLSALFIIYLSVGKNVEVASVNEQANDLVVVQKMVASSVTDIPFDELKTNLHVPNITFENYKSSYGPLPKSLRGTRIPAAFEIDSEGHLVVTSTIKSVIEYFLSAGGEEPIEMLVDRIEEFMAQQLKEPARSDALEVLSQYMSYKAALVELERDLGESFKLSGQGSDYQMLLQYRREARMHNLSPEVYDAFFADEDKEDSYTAGLMGIRRDNSLTDDEKVAQSLAIEQDLPPKEQAVKHAERARVKLNQDITIARAEEAGEAQIFQMRLDIYGYEAAERFAIADKKKFEWNARFTQYRQQRQSIIDSEGLSDADKVSGIHMVQAQLFNEVEQRRLSTLDYMADKGDPAH